MKNSVFVRFLNVTLICLFSFNIKSEMVSKEALFKPKRVELEYDYFAGEKKIGEMVISMKDISTDESSVRLQVEQLINIRLSYMWYNYVLMSRSFGILDNGQLMEYRCHLNDDGVTYEIAGNKGKKQFELRVREKKDAFESVVFSEQDYDMVDFELPESKISSKVPVKKMRVLSLPEMELRDVDFEYLGKDLVKFFDRVYECDMVYYRHEEGAGKVWYTRGPWSPILIKEEGKDEDGPYQIVLRSYSKDD